MAPGSQAACLRCLYRCAIIQCVHIHPGASLPGMAKLRSFDVWTDAEAKWDDGRRPIRKAPVPATSDTLSGVRPRDPDDESRGGGGGASPVMLEVSSGMHLRV